MTREDAIRILEVNRPVMTRRMSTPARRYVEAFEMAISALKENKGEWIIYGFPSSEQIKNCTEDYYCSECKFVVSRFESRACNYCPNCGADMRGEE